MSNNFNQVKQSTSATATSNPRKQQQQQYATNLLIEPLSSSPNTPLSSTNLSLKQTTRQPPSALSLHSKENNQVHQQQQQQSPLKPGDKEQQSGSLVRRESSDLLGGGSLAQQQQKQQQEQWRMSRIEAELADDSIRSQASGATPTTKASQNNNNNNNDRASTAKAETITRRPSPPSSTRKSSPTSTIKQRLVARPHQSEKQQQQPARAFNDSGIEASTSSSNNNEARRLLESGSLTHVDSCACCRCKKHALLLSDEEQGREITKHPIIENMSLASQTIKLVPAYFIAELIGTFLLVLIGDGAAAAYVLTRRQVDVFCVCFAFGVGAMIASFVSGKLSGAHLNPAATVAFALDSKLKWQLVPVYMIAQYVGGFLAALVLFLNYSEAINALDGGERSAFGETNSTGGVFATYPAPYVTAWGSLLDQIVGTAVLLFSLCAVGDKQNMGLEDRFQPPIVALVVGLVCLAFSPNCGAIFNPARDLSPRLLTAIFGYPSVWTPVDGTYWILAGVVGPHIGAVIGVFAYKYLIGTALEANKRHMQMIQNSIVIGGGATTMGGNSFREEKKAGPRLQSYTHHGAQMTTQSAETGAIAGGQRRQEMSDYGSAVMR